MRYALLLLLAPTLLASGCSMLISGAGKDTTAFQTREEVHQQLGEPLSTTTDEEGMVVEEFRSRRKYAEALRAHRQMWGMIATIGTVELISFPLEVGRFVTRRLIGHTLRFTYNADGSVASVSIDDALASFSYLKPKKAEPE